MSSTSTAPDPTARARAYVRWLLRHGRTLCIVAIVVAIPAAARTIWLYAHLRSNIEELLPSGAPSVVALRELRERLPGLRYLGIVVDSKSASNVPAAERFLDDLAGRVEGYPKTLVASVKTGFAEEQEFYAAHPVVFMDIGDLETLRERLQSRRDTIVSREMGIDFDPSEAPPSIDLGDLEAKYRNRRGERFVRNRLSNDDKHLTLMLIQAAEFSTGTELGRDLLGRIQRDIDSLGGLDRYAPGMSLGYTGDIAINAEELSALQQDLAIATLAVAALVLAAVVTFYRWWGSVWALLLPLACAVAGAFAVSTLPPFGIAQLNSNTGFLGSVIVGNGVNFGIIQLARYVDERRQNRSIEDALVLAVSGSFQGTLVAALAAASSYAALTLTEFRGFRQFGVIGAIGIIFSWIAAFSLGPPLIAWLDRRRNGVPRAAPSRHGVAGLVATVVARFPRPILGVAAALIMIAAWGLRDLGRHAIEYDFSRLRRADSEKTGEGFWGRKMDDLLGRYLTPLVVLTDSPEQAAQIAARLRADAREPTLARVVDSVKIARDLVPSDQERKLLVGRDIATMLTPRIRASLSADQKRMIDRYLGPTALAPVTFGDLPESLAMGFRERDGTFDRTVLVYPKLSRALWQGPAVTAMTADLRRIIGGSGDADRGARLAGSLPLSSDIVASIARDGPRATEAALLAVILVVTAIFGLTRATPLIVSSLLLAVFWLAGAMTGLGIKLNFCNFVAFPITFGVGVDYAVNIMARVRQGGPGDTTHAIRTAGGAVGLCSLTTIIGYGSLLLAQNRALLSFGIVAVVGEITCMATAIVVLPAFLVWRREKAALVAALAR